MTATPDKGQRNPMRRPYRVRLPGFVSDDDIGLGDVITKTTSTLGIRSCGGCAQRAAALNRLLVFGRRSHERGS